MSTELKGYPRAADKPLLHSENLLSRRDSFSNRLSVALVAAPQPPALTAMPGIGLVVSAACYLSVQEGPADPAVLEAIQILYDLSEEIGDGQHENNVEDLEALVDSIWTEGVAHWEQLRVDVSRAAPTIKVARGARHGSWIRRAVSLLERTPGPR